MSPGHRTSTRVGAPGPAVSPTAVPAGEQERVRRPLADAGRPHQACGLGESSLGRQPGDAVRRVLVDVQCGRVAVGVLQPDTRVARCERDEQGRRAPARGGTRRGRPGAPVAACGRWSARTGRRRGPRRAGPAPASCPPRTAARGRCAGPPPPCRGRGRRRTRRAPARRGASSPGPAAAEVGDAVGAVGADTADERGPPSRGPGRVRRVCRRGAGRGRRRRCPTRRGRHRGGRSRPWVATMDGRTGSASRRRGRPTGDRRAEARRWSGGDPRRHG